MRRECIPAVERGQDESSPRAAEEGQVLRYVRLIHQACVAAD